MIVQLTYISYSVGTTIDRLENFIDGAKERNSSKGITSIMLVTDTCYIHCIEGERDIVNSLFQKIIQDTRHHSVTLLRFAEITKREFGDFSVAISRLSDFDTYNLGTDQAIQCICPVSITSSRAMSLLRRVAVHNRIPA